ncbi:hypothetical protein ZTR_05250 [Talaromyces verruculosus]|nr:hypothetical protein ZTR_05250 [Talaromyces verruculosus]
MGAQSSKQIAERVISACQSVNGNDQIDEILLKDEIFRKTLASLAQDIPASLRELIEPKRQPQRQDYGGPEITELRSFSSIFKASKPTLDPVIRQFLSSCYKNPQLVLKRSPGKILSGEPSIAEYLDALPVLEEARKIDAICWRLFLVPLPDLIERFNRLKLHSHTLDDIVTVICQSGYTIQKANEIRERLPSWILKGKRYAAIALDIGYGGLCALPEETGDTIWENRIPTEGPVRDACIKLLIDRDIKKVASENISGNDDIITANAAAAKIVRYLKGLIQGFSFLNDSFREENPSKRRKRNETDKNGIRFSSDASQPTSSASHYYQDVPGPVPNERSSFDQSPSQPSSNAMSAEEDTSSNNRDLRTSPSETSMSNDSRDIDNSGINFDFHAAQILSQISRDSAADNIPTNNDELPIDVNDEEIETVADVNTANSGFTASRIAERTGSLNTSYGAAETQPFESVGASSDGNIAATNRQVHQHPRSTADGTRPMGAYGSFLPEQRVSHPSIRPHQLNIPFNGVSSPPVSEYSPQDTSPESQNEPRSDIGTHHGTGSQTSDKSLRASNYYAQQGGDPHSNLSPPQVDSRQLMDDLSSFYQVQQVDSDELLMDINTYSAPQVDSRQLMDDLSSFYQVQQVDSDELLMDTNTYSAPQVDSRQLMDDLSSFYQVQQVDSDELLMDTNTYSAPQVNSREIVNDLVKCN